MSSCAIAAIFFILFPAELGFSRVENIEGYEFMYNTIHAIDRPHNLAPSLHIAYSSLGAYVLSSETQSELLKGMIWIWFLLICSSIVLVHQHHLFDIFTGVILALVVKYLIYDKLINTTNNAAWCINSRPLFCEWSFYSFRAIKCICLCQRMKGQAYYLSSSSSFLRSYLQYLPIEF